VVVLVVVFLVEVLPVDHVYSPLLQTRRNTRRRQARPENPPMKHSVRWRRVVFSSLRIRIPGSGGGTVKGVTSRRTLARRSAVPTLASVAGEARGGRTGRTDGIGVVGRRAGVADVLLCRGKGEESSVKESRDGSAIEVGIWEEGEEEEEGE
jgi:hypothetical protein